MTQFSLGTVQVALSPLERFEEYLQSKGKRFTQQRRSLMEHVFKRHEHFDAEDLIDELSRISTPQRVSRPTVYRTLRELVDAGLLRQMTLGGRAVYEHDYGYPQHDHLHCQKCNKLIEFRSEEVQEFSRRVAREHEFRATGHRLIISGICQECGRQRRRKRPQDLI
ncbi:MAG: transcriptional repressor [Planctomycetaceae bacterium]|nr:transcriptional repressor [Planctomycetaceae bacterium]